MEFYLPCRMNGFACDFLVSMIEHTIYRILNTDVANSLCAYLNDQLNLGPLQKFYCK